MGSGAYEMLHNLLADRKGDVVFSCFGIWHGLYLTAFFGAIGLLVFWLRKKAKTIQRRATDTAINIAFGLYIADFFLMPFAYGQIDLEKLPFHACTAMCVMCFVSRHSRGWEKCRQPFAILGLISNLIYVVYPAGVGWYQVHPLSYRVIQTLLFHAVMTGYGLLVLIFETEHLDGRSFARDMTAVAGMTLWAMLGNALYGGLRKFNWFFVLQDPFYMLPESIAPFVMPFVMILVFGVANGLLYGAYFWIKRCGKKEKV